MTLDELDRTVLTQALMNYITDLTRMLDEYHIDNDTETNITNITTRLHRCFTLYNRIQTEPENES